VLRYEGLTPQATPYFSCLTCERGFSRKTGKPLEGFRCRDRLPAFIRLLSQQKPVSVASRALKVSPQMVKRWVDAFRAWLLAIDPSGHWEAKIRLGIKAPAPRIACPRCGAERLRPLGFASRKERPSIKRIYRCQACGASRSFAAEKIRLESPGGFSVPSARSAASDKSDF
jgi:transposase-like protein